MTALLMDLGKDARWDLMTEVLMEVTLVENLECKTVYLWVQLMVKLLE